MDLQDASGYSFYNTSPYTFTKLLDDPDNIASNLKVYINGFSENVIHILKNLNLNSEIDRMDEANLLYTVIKEFTTPQADLHPDRISNIEMGYIFEEIIRRFSEAHNKAAGEYYTPREVIRLMVNLLFHDDNELLVGDYVTRTIYDCACGTGGMLSVATEYLNELNSEATVTTYGQEINLRTAAICQADMLIKGGDPSFIAEGNTLSDDKFPGRAFDYIISNPPFGTNWGKNQSLKAAIEAEHKRGAAGRFAPGLPNTTDGQMLFLLNAISKMKPIEDGGSRIAIVHSGSPLFTGDAGNGASEIRRYILEKDLLEAIVALPTDIFYNTNIPTYIWVLSNKKKGTVREGKVQLINGKQMFEKRRKSLGEKRNDIPESAIDEITRMYGDFVESKISQIFDNADFGYTKITVDRPLIDEEGNLVLKNGKRQADTSLRDTENIPLKEDIQEYFEREVLPFVPDAWIVKGKDKSKVGYEIPFTRYFYEYKAPRSADEIMNEIRALEGELSSSLEEVFK